MAYRQGLPVDVLLERFTPEQFDEIVAVVRIDGDEATRNREIWKRGFAMMSLAKLEPDDFDAFADKQEAKPTGGAVSVLKQHYGA